jgi:biopolymer transport protein ExbD
VAGGFSSPQQGTPERGKKRFHARRALSDPPAMLLVDIAFNLLLFFLACASSDPQAGRKQVIPRGEATAQSTSQSENIELSLTRTTVTVNGNPTNLADVPSKLRSLLSGKQRVEERIVVVKSTKDTPYSQWIRVTGWIEQAGGVTTLQLEESREVAVP